MIRQWIQQTLAACYPDALFDVLVPPDAAMGDYSVNLAFVLAKREKKNPRDVAAEICAVLTEKGAEMLEKCEVAGPGFVNIFLTPAYLQKSFDQDAMPQPGAGQKVIVEYSAPNIAKPMSVGHLRSTIIGDALARVHAALGYEVVKWNYLGDWGTQFGKLIAAWRRYDGALQELSITNLVALYVRFHKEEAENPELEKLGQEEFHKLETGDEENRALWEQFRTKSLKEFQRMYDRLGVQFDVIKGESDYEKVLPKVVAGLMPLMTLSEGAQVIMLDDVGLPPALIQKSDGSSIYMARDIASLQDRVEHYHPTRICYVVGNEQALHFEQLFAVAQKIGISPRTELVHVKFGLVLGEDGKKFSTRKGNVVLLEDLIQELTTRAVSVARTKNTELSDADVSGIAEIIALGALKYNDLRQHPHTDIVFDWDAMLDLSGNSGPYLQYTYARLGSIRAKSGAISHADRAELSHPVERLLMRHLLEYGYAVAACTSLSALNGLALHLYELATLANRYYEQVHINDDDNAARKAARLELITAVMEQLKAGLDLLGIQTLERI